MKITNKMKASVIISFYQKIEYLKFVLAGLERQTERDFEIIIADDGSDLSVVKEVEILSNKITNPLFHIWQEDKGFRKNKILNMAIETSNADLLIFIDGDCVPHSEFVKEHILHNQKGVCNTGRRVNLSEKITNLLTADKVRNGFLENKKYRLIYDGLFGKTNYVEKGFYVKNKFLRKTLNKKERGLLGCNFSISKKDILDINGFDERYEAPSIGEDTDIQHRLEIAGTKIKSLQNIAVQYHLYHKLQTRPQKNMDLFKEVKKENTSFTNFGIIKK